MHGFKSLFTPHSQGSVCEFETGTCSLLAGPPGSGKTSFAFQCAVNVASAEPLRRVLFVCCQERITSWKPRTIIAHDQPTVASNASTPIPSVLNRIDVKYVDSRDSLNKLLSNLHLLPELPVAVILDDLMEICKIRQSNILQGHGNSLVQIFALLNNAMEAKQANDLTVSYTIAVVDDSTPASMQMESPCRQLSSWVSDWYAISMSGPGQVGTTSSALGFNAVSTNCSLTEPATKCAKWFVRKPLGHCDEDQVEYVIEGNTIIVH